MKALTAEERRTNAEKILKQKLKLINVAKSPDYTFNKTIEAMIEFSESEGCFNESDLIDLRQRCAENATLLIEKGNLKIKGQLAYIAESNEHFEIDKESILSTPLTKE